MGSVTGKQGRRRERSTERKKKVGKVLSNTR